jgi:hypothetical protein
MQIQALKEVKNAISQEATRFSGHQQHVIYISFNFIYFQLYFKINTIKIYW